MIFVLMVTMNILGSIDIKCMVALFFDVYEMRR